MALNKFGIYRIGKRVSVAEAIGKVSVDPGAMVTRSWQVKIAEIPVKIVGTAALPDAPVVKGYGLYKSSGFRAAKLRSKVDRALRESDQAREEAKSSGDMVVIAS